MTDSLSTIDRLKPDFTSIRPSQFVCAHNFPAKFGIVGWALCRLRPFADLTRVSLVGICGCFAQTFCTRNLLQGGFFCSRKVRLAAIVYGAVIKTRFRAQGLSWVDCQADTRCPDSAGVILRCFASSCRQRRKSHVRPSGAELRCWPSAHYRKTPYSGLSFCCSQCS